MPTRILDLKMIYTQDDEILSDIDTVITELKVTDPLQEEWAEAVREHSGMTLNDANLDRILYVMGYTLLARARLLGGMDQVGRDTATVARHLQGK